MAGPGRRRRRDRNDGRGFGRLPHVEPRHPVNPYGEPEEQLCLTRRQAARVFDLLESGVNTARLRVDDGRRGRFSVDVGLASYTLVRTPCRAG